MHLHIFFRTELKLCNCNFDKFFDKYGLEIDSFTVAIINAKTSEQYAKINDQFISATNIHHVTLPISVEYIICVNNLVGNYFTFESGSIDDKKIIINEEKKTYYSSEVTIKGFGTNDNDCFLFIAPSNNNVTNMIRLKFCMWRREEKIHQPITARFCDIRYSDNDRQESYPDDHVTFIGMAEFTIQLIYNQYETNKGYGLKKAPTRHEKMLIRIELEAKKALSDEKKNIEYEISNLQRRLVNEYKLLAETKNSITSESIANLIKAELDHQYRRLANIEIELIKYDH